MGPELIAITGVFAFVALIVGSGMSWYLATNSVEAKRLRQLTVPVGAPITIRQSALAESVDPALARLSRLMPRSPAEMSKLQKRLTRAGYPRAGAAVVFAIVEIALPVVLALLVLVLVGLSEGFVLALCAGAFGYVVPGFWVSRRTTARQKAILNGLPDALDMMTVCVEAGSGLDQAIAKCSEELGITHPAMAEELRTVVTEIRAGKPRTEALRNLAERTGLEDIRTLVSMLAQTDRFGTSIGQALRVQAETSRTKRRQAAEERAAKVGVKLVFPLVLCLFPALYVVCFGPVVVQVYRAFIDGQ